MTAGEHTAFVFKEGKLQIRLTWVFRVLTTLLLLLANVVVSTSLRTVEHLKTAVIDMQQDLAVIRASTIDTDQDHKLSDHEDRLRELEGRGSSRWWNRKK